ncbi:replication restart helicase PriA [Acetoanaerobium noterae]|uniref:replication restart helicase PriA n=1 Tax=Acetoanaerobium noterae TaxID=745369 RepID=UPI0028A96E45|nr:primosomal protein N' [Acetoanaerobium noterae]
MVEKYCKVVLIQKSRYIDKKFTYKTYLDVCLGQIVYVPFGRGNKQLEAIIVEIQEKLPCDEDKLKEIVSLGEKTNLDYDKIALAFWIRDYYMCSYLDALSLLYPSQIRKGSAKFEDFVVLKDKLALELEYLDLKTNAHVKKYLYKLILDNVELSRDRLNEEFKGKNISAYINNLKEKEIIEIKSSRIFRDSSNDNINNTTYIKHALNKEQNNIFEEISDELSTKNRPVLLKGITGSGKTEIYMELIDKMIKEGKGSIVLVPEISLTPQTIARFTARFKAKVAVLHSHLSVGQRYDEWSKIENIEAPVVIGARSALFAPVRNLGLIVIDECHEDAYRSELNPKYDSVEVACKLNELQAVSVILGSATPKIEQYYKAKNEEYKLVELSKRANNKPLPSIEIIDMKEDAKLGNLSFLSFSLQTKISLAMKKKEQVILFLNRRGYANFLSCDSCGHVPKCKNCDISLTYHKKNQTLRCHYCNFEIPFHKACESCNEGKMKDIGIGTERIEAEVRELFPEAKVFRMDKDTVSRKNSHSEILSAFKHTKGAILIGTQMIGKGLDFPMVSLVGVINADQGLNAPDFRSYERMFSLIEQVGGRAGRGDIDGNVLIQTFSPDNYVLKYILNHDFEGFYSEEIKLRETFNYLPYNNIIRVLVSSINEQNAANSSMQIKDAIIFYLKKKAVDNVNIMGPFPCLVSKIENKYRWQILIKDSEVEIHLIKSIINYILTEKRSVVLLDNVNASVDINPINMV